VVQQRGHQLRETQGRQGRAGACERDSVWGTGSPVSGWQLAESSRLKARPPSLAGCCHQVLCISWAF
jgi:hypothetical protein